jgi:hypothetical protein
VGVYRYDFLVAGEREATEQAVVSSGRITGVRTSAHGGGSYEVDAELGADGSVRRLRVRSARGPFERAASYECVDGYLRGNVSALAGSTPVAVKLGRFGELDADLVVLKALIILRARGRGLTRFTGRVAVIDPATLVASAVKQTYRQKSDDPRRWVFEPRLGDADDIELDAGGRIVSHRDRRGREWRLVSFQPAG